MKIGRRLLSGLNSALAPAGYELSRRQSGFVESGGIRFRVTSKRSRSRALSLLTKEPSTIAWIDTFSADDVFWDVGANVGAYTLYAAKRGCRVIAFEPAYFNFALLNDNILANGLSDRASACCIALNDRSELNALNLSSVDPGSSLHSFASDVTYTGETFRPAARQAVLGMTLDDFASLPGVAAPGHLKIDVDGNEAKVLSGGRTMLTDPRLKSVMVELNLAWKEQFEAAHDLLHSAGLRPQRRAASNTPDVENCFFTRASV